MGRLEKMKERYNEIVIPEELNIRVQQEIMKSRGQQAKKKSFAQRNRFKKVIRSIEAAAAAVCIVFTAALNISPVFAKEAAQFPIIGGLAQILTFRSYETEKDNIAVSVEIPTIEMIAADTGITSGRVGSDAGVENGCCQLFAGNGLLSASVEV